MASVVITQVLFGEQGMEITYFETRDQGESVGIMKTMMIGITNDIKDRVISIQDDLLDIVDAGLLQLRNPPKRLTTKDRLRDHRETSEDE